MIGQYRDRQGVALRQRTFVGQSASPGPRVRTTPTHIASCARRSVTVAVLLGDAPIPRAHGKSARIRATSSSVIIGKSSGVSNTMRPDSDIRRPMRLIPRRAMVEIASPSRTPLDAARHRAASSTSSSIESVVRMVPLYRELKAMSSALMIAVLPRFRPLTAWHATLHTTTRSGV